MAVSRRLRYEILRRDDHACRYCGARAPEVTLTVDHVKPVALGGGAEPSNLVTACRDCNSGKSSVPADAPLVDAVSDDAIRWAAAMNRAADLQLLRLTDMRTYRTKFLEDWNAWTYGYEGERLNFDLPNNWEQSLDQFRDRGVDSDLISEAVDVALGRYNVKDRFAYFCGVVWKMYEQRQEIAASLLATEDEA